MVICLELGADLRMAQLMPLPLTVSCFSKIQIGFTFLVPPHLGRETGECVRCALYSFFSVDFNQVFRALISILCLILCLQCFDAVGWAAGRASGL